MPSSNNFMHKFTFCILTSSLFINTSTMANEQVKEYPATLAGHAILPANSFIATPDDAPENLQSSGKYISSVRNEKLNSAEGLSEGRPTGIFSPFKGQPLQGHSGIKRMQDGTYWIITDNGAGTKENSPDFMLYLNHYDVDFKTGQFKLLDTVFLHDPDKKIPFHIINESTQKRYLTGADLDPESFQIIDGNFWIGEEFGPYLIKADKTGRVLALFETTVNDQVIKSPNHYSLKTPNTPQDKINFDIKRSKGFEGMAMSPDGSKLYALLEGPIWQKDQQQYENDNDQNYLRILEFDVAKEQWTGRFWKYPLALNSNAIGDFNMINNTRGLIIERDDGEGVKEKACTDSKDTKHCFNNLAAFKRVYLIELSEKNVNNTVNKLGYIDLLNIKDPNKLARKPLNEGVLKFPFLTIENVDIVDNNHIIVGNDNNLPFSSSRDPNKADDNELILLEVGQLLNAK